MMIKREVAKCCYSCESYTIDDTCYHDDAQTDYFEICELYKPIDVMEVSGGSGIDTDVGE